MISKIDASELSHRISVERDFLRVDACSLKITLGATLFDELEQKQY